jgi:hypothetical protein
MAAAVPPARSIMEATACTSLAVRATSVTCAPTAASVRATSAPIPRPAPVTSAWRPASSALSFTPASPDAWFAMSFDYR